MQLLKNKSYYNGRCWWQGGREKKHRENDEYLSVRKKCTLKTRLLFSQIVIQYIFSFLYKNRFFFYIFKVWRKQQL